MVIGGKHPKLLILLNIGLDGQELLTETKKNK